MACAPEFSVEFSASPEFSGGVTAKYMSTGGARTFDLQIMNQILYHCATASLCKQSYDIHCVPCWDFPTVSVVTGSRIFRPYMEDGAFSPEGKASSAPSRSSSVPLLCGMTEEREGVRGRL